ncbi:Txe/YoeB family addiction module toxin [Mucilaginibacter pedocola]|uniref:Putative mRNA interferase YoeB n=1 Tax=Mucilaginibacter pedocola TaxID=1792845 RepID=A0A1S9PI37_9SPHI|nr:Txe/YoeB family addiction module toxin [Mucilaginibacter pedocola]OOQ60602.1 toxin of toxin-antitoxin system [Mucilaginibacter pedocola]
MEIELFADAIEDLKYWKKSGNQIVQKKIQQLFVDVQAHPFEGIGKPEALKYNLSGKWSRRITSEHRMVYEVVDETIRIYSLRGHY